eukprot:2932064-Amphidinium_carterae.1
MVINSEKLRNCNGYALLNARLSDTGLHQAAKRWQDVDWWVDLPVVQAAIDKHLRTQGDASGRRVLTKQERQETVFTPQ